MPNFDLNLNFIYYFLKKILISSDELVKEKKGD